MKGRSSLVHKQYCYVFKKILIHKDIWLILI